MRPITESNKPPRSRVRAVVFDYDGTLAEHADNAKRLGRILSSYAATPVAHDAIWNATSDYQLIEALVPPERRDHAIRQMLAVNLEIAASPRRLPGLAPLLQELAGRCRLLIYSGRDQTSLEAALRHQNLSRWFAEIKGAGPGIPAKPHPGPLKELLGLHGITPAEAVYVGDGHADGELAAATGCGYVVAGWFRQARHSSGALGYAQSLADLKSLLNPLMRNQDTCALACGSDQTAGIR